MSFPFEAVYDNGRAGWSGKEKPLLSGWTSPTIPADFGHLNVTASDRLEEDNLWKSAFERIHCAFPRTRLFQHSAVSSHFT